MNSSVFYNSLMAIEDENQLQYGEFVRGDYSLGTYAIDYEQQRVSREAGRACARLIKTYSDTLSKIQLERVIRKVTEFVDCMDGLFDLDESNIRFDPSEEECISISFEQDKHMSLDLYFDDEDDIVNEAYLSFITKGKLQIMNDSIPNIADVIKTMIY